MASKIVNLSELEGVLCNNEKTHEGVLQFFSAFKIGPLLSSYNGLKSKGLNVSVLLLSLIIFRLRNESIRMMQNQSRNFLEVIDDNTFYRLMNHQWMNWRKLLMAFAKQFAAHVKVKGDAPAKLTCFVIDDTDIEKTGKTIEFISRIFNHVTHLYPLGYKMLLLSFWDGKSLFSVDFSLHREKGKKGTYGSTNKELKSQFKKKRDEKSPGYKRTEELDKKKGEVAVSMLKRAVKNGFIATYVLMDSWFMNDHMIKSIRSIRNGAMHLLGMCKIDMRKYQIGKKEMNAHQAIKMKERSNSHYSRKYKSSYISIVADYKGEKVRLFFIRYKNAKKWSLLLTTDLSLSFVQAIEIYQIRWTIEVLFKECKQYLKLGGSQSTDFDGQIADITITLITHTILTIQKRFSSYETMGDLFRQTQQHLLELTLWDRLIQVFLKLLLELAILLDIQIEETMEKLFQQDQVSKPLMALLKTLKEFEENDQNNKKTDFRCALAS